jgi:hypothetical protein
MGIKRVILSDIPEVAHNFHFQQIAFFSRVTGFVAKYVVWGYHMTSIPADGIGAFRSLCVGLLKKCRENAELTLEGISPALWLTMV